MLRANNFNPLVTAVTKIHPRNTTPGAHTHTNTGLLFFLRRTRGLCLVLSNFPSLSNVSLEIHYRGRVTFPLASIARSRTSGFCASLCPLDATVRTRLASDRRRRFDFYTARREITNVQSPTNITVCWSIKTTRIHTAQTGSSMVLHTTVVRTGSLSTDVTRARFALTREYAPSGYNAEQNTKSKRTHYSYYDDPSKRH